MAARIGRNKKRRLEEEAEAREEYEQHCHEWNMRRIAVEKERVKLRLKQVELGNQLLAKRNKLHAQLLELGYPCRVCNFTGGLFMELPTLEQLVAVLTDAHNNINYNNTPAGG